MEVVKVGRLVVCSRGLWEVILIPVFSEVIEAVCVVCGFEKT
jgi:hypothetical protein